MKNSKNCENENRSVCPARILFLNSLSVRLSACVCCLTNAWTNVQTNKVSISDFSFFELSHKNRNPHKIEPIRLTINFLVVLFFIISFAFRALRFAPAPQECFKEAWSADSCFLKLNSPLEASHTEWCCFSSSSLIFSSCNCNLSNNFSAFSSRSFPSMNFVKSFVSDALFTSLLHSGHVCDSWSHFSMQLVW